MAGLVQWEELLAALRRLGGSAGNGRIREALHWDEVFYEAVKQAHIKAGTIVNGHGCGGCVAIAGKDVQERSAQQTAQVDRQVRAARPNITAANVGYRAEFWFIADSLRGSMDSADHKHLTTWIISSIELSSTHSRMLSVPPYGAQQSVIRHPRAKPSAPEWYGKSLGCGILQGAVTDNAQCDARDPQASLRAFEISCGVA
ncbi:hypothetical protein [Azospirillum sp. ST 5-10]|uniref:hypothetical protein n=1 Tax=unclassified Azospirillum TaxID=2630922 RepID=UPI003F4A63B1